MRHGVSPAASPLTDDGYAEFGEARPAHVIVAGKRCRGLNGSRCLAFGIRTVTLTLPPDRDRGPRADDQLIPTRVPRGRCGSSMIGSERHAGTAQLTVVRACAASGNGRR
jgi:hypothetical protein